MTESLANWYFFHTLPSKHWQYIHGRSLTKSLMGIMVIFSVLARRAECGTLPWSRLWGGDLPNGVFADKTPGLPCGKCSTTKSRLWHFPSCLPLLLWFQQRWQVFPLLRGRLFVELLFLNRTAQMFSVDTQVCATGEGNGFLFACVASANGKDTWSSSKQILRSDIIAKQIGVYQG